MKLKATGDGRGVDAQEVRRALALLADPKLAIQLQYAPFHGQSFRTFAGTPDGLDEAARWVAVHAGAKGVYFALNPVPAGYPRQVTCKSVVYRRWLLVDIDRAKAPDNKDLSATDAEHEAARSLMYDVLEYLDGRGWPTPWLVDSGNGFHMLFRMDLPNNDVATGGVKTTLARLARRFNDERGTIGAECYDARRISALPGTWKRKGAASPERPHRMVKLIGGPGA